MADMSAIDRSSRYVVNSGVGFLDETSPLARRKRVKEKVKVVVIDYSAKRECTGVVRRAPRKAFDILHYNLKASSRFVLGGTDMVLAAVRRQSECAAVIEELVKSSIQCRSFSSSLPRLLFRKSVREKLCK